MLVQSVHFTFSSEDAGKAGDMLDELRAASRAESGVVGFDVVRSREKPNEFALWEQYRDDGALESHKATEHYKRLVLEGVRRLAQQRDAVLGKPD
jgi:quinol monooxygenase YgiN